MNLSGAMAAHDHSTIRRARCAILLKFASKQNVMHGKGLLMVAWLLISGAPAFSQFQNILIYEQEGDAPLFDPTIALHPRNPDIRVAGSAPGNVHYTKDGGLTWTTERLSPAGRGHADPVVIAGPKGSFYYFHVSDPASEGDQEGQAFDRIAVQSSQDGGVSWSAAEPIGFSPEREQRDAWATTDARGSLYVTWTQFGQDTNADSCASNVLFSMSKNGKKWSDPVILSQAPGNCLDDGRTAAGAIPAVTFDGKVVAAWSRGEKILIDRSFNGGERWLSNDIPVADQAGGRQLTIPGHSGCNAMPVLMTDISKGPFRGSLYLVWADQRNGEDDTDIWFSRTHNFGDNWSTPLRIHKDKAGKHQYLPWLAVDQETGYLYVLYYDRRNYDDLQTDVYLAYSIDGGASFKEMRISERAFSPAGQPFRGHLSAHGGIIAPIWARTDEGKTSLWTASIRHEDLVNAEAPEKK